VWGRGMAGWPDSHYAPVRARSLTLAGLILALAAAAGAQTLPVEPPVLRVVALNLLHGGVLSGLTGEDQSLEARLDLVAAALEELAPDVGTAPRLLRPHLRGRLSDGAGRRHRAGPPELPAGRPPRRSQRG
jgi:hypothetical protein